MSVHNAATAATIRSIVDCESLPAVADSILRPVARLLNADSAVYLQFHCDDYGRPAICQSSYTGRRPETLDEYMSGFFAEDPVLKPMMERPQRWKQFNAPMKLHLSRQVKRSQLRGTDYFRNFLHPNNLGDVLGLVVPIDCDGPKMLCVGLHRSEQSPRFTQPQNAALEAISGPLRVVLQNLCLKTAINEQAALVQALDRSDSGVEFAVLDQRLRVQRASRRLRDLFRHLPAGSRQLAQLRAAARDLERRVARGGEVHTPIELAGKLSAELRIVRGREESHFVLVVPDARRDGAQPPALPPRPRQEVGITRREQDVVEQVASGLSNAQVASALGISIRTVENHLRAIYDKLGVNSRTQLIHRVYDY
ncbi:helix-turn-helix transcriptional regulator [Parahaliea mediterranea]|uniref:HTH luxR-type domain-containing protein n=1 Tax=Parahaliea mediterranea TaxID=651086 RepID=A0A939DE86_9GAMM|nr:helix-turn-helix transcriptional regulator [Parahaliea mediterranea]MBN7796628.1 hypothetical protein [Parahaliea mediterranea]